MKIGEIILSRMGSTRLPSKALKFVDGNFLFSCVLSCGQKMDGLDVFTIATTTHCGNNPLLDFADVQPASGAEYFEPFKWVIDKVKCGTTDADISYSVRLSKAYSLKAEKVD